jgi:predicted acyl esterase
LAIGYLVGRTPYSCHPYGEDKLTPVWHSAYFFRYAEEKYILVFQDVRGKFMSEGTYQDIRPFIKNKTAKQFDEASDAYDAIDWLVKNVPGNNHQVGVFGISAPGFFATMAAACGHPALKAVSPQAPVTGENAWRKFEQWPPKNMHAQSIYTIQHGSLSFSKATTADNTYDEYVSDPAKPFIKQKKRILKRLPYVSITVQQLCCQC